MSAKIYILVGVNNQYSERTEWIVTAYYNQAAAVEHAVLAKTESQNIEKEFNEGNYGINTENKYDPKNSHYWNNNYEVHEVEIFDAIPGIDV